jgi:hypothetical protein
VRHLIKFLVRCDIIDHTGRGWPATISSIPDEFFIGLLLLTPHSNGGRKLCAALNKGDILSYQLGLNIYEARVAAKVTGRVWLHGFDVNRNAIRPIHVVDDDDPRVPRYGTKKSRADDE